MASVLKAKLNGAYLQPTLAGCVASSAAEISLDNCVLTSEPRFTRRRQREAWSCIAVAGPDT